MSQQQRERMEGISYLESFYKEYYAHRFKDVDVRYNSGYFIFDYRSGGIVDALKPIFQILDNPKKYVEHQIKLAQEELERRKVITQDTQHHHLAITYFRFKDIKVEDIEIHIAGRLLTRFRISPDKIPIKSRYRRIDTEINRGLK